MIPDRELQLRNHLAYLSGVFSTWASYDDTKKLRDRAKKYRDLIHEWLDDNKEQLKNRHKK